MICYPGYGISDGSEKHVLIIFFRFYQPILTRLGALFWKFYSPYLVFETQNAIYTGSGSNSPISGFYLFFPTTFSHLDPRNVPYGKRYVVDVMRSNVPLDIGKILCNGVNCVLCTV